MNNLNININREAVLGIDIGGGSIKAAPVDIINGKRLQEPHRIITPQPSTPQAMKSVFLELIESFSWKNRVGFGFPGVVKKCTVHTAANLSAKWIGQSFHDLMDKSYKEGISAINDADAAALAEMRYGAGQENNQHGGGVVLIITLGTGIGSALIVDGHLVPNTEFGHIEINCKDAETLAAGSIREKEHLSWEDWGGALNKYLQTMEAMLSPDLYIVGGGVSENWKNFIQFIKLGSRIVPATLGNDAGIIGAALAANLC